jgi:hypothetical protein
MSDTSDTAMKWRQRVAGWRASGETAATYSARHGFTTSSLRYWASRFRREDAIAGPVVRLAQVVHAPSTQRDEGRRGTVVIELLDARARIKVASDADRAVLAMVLEVLDRGAR